MTRRDSGAESMTGKCDGTAEASRKVVIRYSLCLLAAVIFFTVLSYLIQQRDNARLDKLYTENATATQHIETLREEYNALQEKYDDLLVTYNNLLDEIETGVSAND